MSELNFDGINEAEEMNIVAPGTIALFQVIKGEKKSNANGKDYLELTFQQDTGSEFRHQFYLSKGALPRIQHLYKAITGNKIEGAMTVEGLVQAFKSKKFAMKVTGRVGNNGKSYCDLSFGGFAAPADKLNELSFTPKEQAAIDEAIENERNSLTIADSEAGAPKGESKENVEDDNF
jgi:hypothetical protein